MANETRAMSVERLNAGILVAAVLELLDERGGITVARGES